MSAKTSLVLPKIKIQEPFRPSCSLAKEQKESNREAQCKDEPRGLELHQGEGRVHPDLGLRPPRRPAAGGEVSSLKDSRVDEAAEAVQKVSLSEGTVSRHDPAVSLGEERFRADVELVLHEVPVHLANDVQDGAALDPGSTLD